MEKDPFLVELLGLSVSTSRYAQATSKHVGLALEADISLYMTIATPSYVPKQCNYHIMQPKTMHYTCMFKQSKMHIEHLHNRR
jgi:hypothetical protein